MNGWWWQHVGQHAAAAWWSGYTGAQCVSKSEDVRSWGKAMACQASLDAAKAVMCRCGQAVPSSVCFPSVSMGRSGPQWKENIILIVCSVFSSDSKISTANISKLKHVEALRARLQKGLWRKKVWSQAARMYLWFIFYTSDFVACWNLFLHMLGESWGPACLSNLQFLSPMKGVGPMCLSQPWFSQGRQSLKACKETCYTSCMLHFSMHFPEISSAQANTLLRSPPEAVQCRNL